MKVETRAALLCIGYFAIATGWTVSVRVFPAPWPFWSAVALMAVAVAGAAWIAVLVCRGRAAPALVGALQLSTGPKRITAAELADRLDQERGVTDGRRR